MLPHEFLGRPSVMVMFGSEMDDFVTRLIDQCSAPFINHNVGIIRHGTHTALLEDCFLKWHDYKAVDEMERLVKRGCCGSQELAIQCWFEFPDFRQLRLLIGKQQP